MAGFRECFRWFVGNNLYFQPVFYRPFYGLLCKAGSFLFGLLLKTDTSGLAGLPSNVCGTRSRTELLWIKNKFISIPNPMRDNTFGSRRADFLSESSKEKVIEIGKVSTHLLKHSFALAISKMVNIRFPYNEYRVIRIKRPSQST